jgi:hypothetical protein
VLVVVAIDYLLLEHRDALAILVPVAQTLEDSEE